MKCPFCQQELYNTFVKSPSPFSTRININEPFNSAYCNNSQCMIRDMTRFIIESPPDNLDQPFCMIFIGDGFHVVVDYRKNFTLIHKLDEFFLSDPLLLPTTVTFDLQNFHLMMLRIKTWLVFS